MDTTTEHGVVIPSGVNVAPREPGVLPAGPQRGMIVNETDLPDDAVRAAVETYFEEHASMLGVNAGGSSFSTYANEGSLLARSKYRTPRNVLEEIVLARDLAERDDDVAAAMGAMLAIAFGDGMAHTHEDETTIAMFDEIAKHTNLDATLQEIYRELLISSQAVTVHLFTREQFPFKPTGADRARTRNVVAPLVGVIPSEQIRVLDDDLFGTGTLAYKPATGAQEKWLLEFFDTKTSAGRKAEMRRENPVLATLLIRQHTINDLDAYSLNAEALYDPAYGNQVYVLNPNMIARSTFPKGSWKYPRPLLTRNFALLEAKRLLNIMDYALLQGGSNFLVVAKKGSDQRPAQPEEVSNLREVIKRASRTGVIVGDHRLAIEIITPDLKELLNAAKRNLLGKKIAMGLLRLPGFTEASAGAGQAVLTDTEIISRVVSSDRRLVRRHMENKIYAEIVKRNSAQFPQGAAGIWFPKIVLQGLNYFTDMVLKLRDRGDISRSSAVQAAGFDYRAEVQQRKREKPDDRTMTPAGVPFSSPQTGQPGAGGSPGPQDNGGGRPRGGSSANGRPGSQPSRSTRDAAAPRRVIQRNAGETVHARYEEDGDFTYRVGEVTEAILEEYGTEEYGRMTPIERRALEAIQDGDMAPFCEGPITVVPVNGDYEIAQVRVMRLAEGLSILVGRRDEDDALVARALCFREPEFDPLSAQETALRWGFESEVAGVPGPAPAPELEEELARADPPQPTVIVLPAPTSARFRTVLDRDEQGNITGTHQEPIEEGA